MITKYKQFTRTKVSVMIQKTIYNILISLTINKNNNDDNGNNNSTSYI